MRRTRTVRVGELLGDLFKDPAIRRKIAEGRLPETWAQAAGPRVAECTEDVSFRGGILTVRIPSSALRHEVFMQRGSLRDRINALAGAQLVREVIVK